MLVEIGDPIETEMTVERLPEVCNGSKVAEKITNLDAYFVVREEFLRI
jgi:hypothetical protein